LVSDLKNVKVPVPTVVEVPPPTVAVTDVYRSRFGFSQKIKICGSENPRRDNTYLFQFSFSGAFFSEKTKLE